jgi:hypothetical protein
MRQAPKTLTTAETRFIELMDRFKTVIEAGPPDDLYISSANLEIAGTLLACLANSRARGNIQSVRIKRISDNTLARLETMGALGPEFQDQLAANLNGIKATYPDTLECAWDGLPPFHGMLFGDHLSWGYWQVNEQGRMHARRHEEPITPSSDQFRSLQRKFQAGIWRRPDGVRMNSREIVIQSGGQTGVDRTALDFAIELGLKHAGWCPQGRAAEDGRIDDRYVLRETAGDEPEVRTRTNICTSDATVILSASASIEKGTLLTKTFCEAVGKPCLHLSAAQVDAQTAGDLLRQFIVRHGVKQLNVAGPRASEQPTAADYARRVLQIAWRGELSADSPNWQIVGWLVPAPDDRILLTRKIDALASKFGVASFLPHCTVLVGGAAEPEALERVLVRASELERLPLTLKVEQIEAGNEPRLTLHVSLCADADFLAFREALEGNRNDGFKVDDQRPHLSLLYRNRGLNPNEVAAAKQIVGELPGCLRFASFRAIAVPRDRARVDPSLWRLLGEVMFLE